MRNAASASLRLGAVCVLVLLLACGAPSAAPAEPALGGRLAREVVLFADTLDAAAALDLPAPDRERLERYIERRDRFRSGLLDEPADAAREARVGVERAIVSLVDREDIGPAAADVARHLDVAPAGTRDLPRTLGEIASAEQYLRAHPGTPAAPFLYAFLASRCRIGIEVSSDPGDKERLARKYRTMLDRLRNSADPIFPLLARDLDGLPSLVARQAEHPRDYLPPG